MKQLVFITLLALILSGCSRSLQPAPTPLPAPQVVDTTPAPSPPTGSLAEEPAPSSRLLPQETGIYSFRLQDGFSGQSRMIDEEWVRDGSRLLAAQNGRPYVTWLLAADGVWRADPQNPSVLLRYLPPELVDGVAWRQRSGNDWVYFRLRSEPTPNSAWVLTILNRGERSEWRFSGYHQVLAENPARPDAIFLKEGGGRPENPLTLERKAAIVATAQPLPEVRAAVEAVNPAQFVGVLAALPGYERRSVDLNGDGAPESLVGVFTRETWFGPELLDPTGKVLERAQIHAEAGQFTLATVGGQPRFLILSHGGRVSSLHMLWFEQSAGKWKVGWGGSLGPKLIGWTPATRFQVLADGRVQVEWEPQYDPAHHRRVRHFTVNPKGEVQWLDESWAPAEAQLRTPETPLDLIQAFLFAQWYGFQDEAKRYLARPEMAAAYPQKDQPKPFVTEGRVEVGRVGKDCVPVKGKAPATGPIPFFAELGGYEGATVQHGTAQVGRAPDGRLVIESIQFEPSCFWY